MGIPAESSIPWAIGQNRTKEWNVSISASKKAGREFVQNAGNDL